MFGKSTFEGYAHSIRPKSLQKLIFMGVYKKDVRIFGTISSVKHILRLIMLYQQSSAQELSPHSQGLLLHCTAEDLIYERLHGVTVPGYQDVVVIAINLHISTLGLLFLMGKAGEVGR